MLAKILIVASCLLIAAESVALGKCGAKHFQCEDGSCILKTQFCNGVKDCSSGEDETGCKVSNAYTSTESPGCNSDQFQCCDGRCISRYWVCDGEKDCALGEDETNCYTELVARSKCEHKHFQCGDGSCILKTQFCNGVKDCSSGEDETGCKVSNDYTSTESPGCNSDQFQCCDGRCIYRYWVCDGEKDCTLGEDEANCYSDWSTTSYPWTTGPYTTRRTTWYPWTTEPRTTRYTTWYPWTTEPRTTRYPWTTEPHTTRYPWTTEPRTTRYTTWYPWTTEPPTTWYPWTTKRPTTMYPETSTAATSPPPIHTTPAPPVSCDHPYDLVGGRCIFIDPVLHATWDEARYICGRAGGDLAVLDSMSFFGDLVKYMMANGLDLHEYWIGGRGVSSENQWKWISGSEVLMGTPLWALINRASSNYSDVYEQEPVDFYKSLQNCGYLDVDRFHYMNDDDCSDLKAAVCELPTWTILNREVLVNNPWYPKPAKVSESEASVQIMTVPPVSCDHPYAIVGDRCVVIDPVLDATWDEARYICGMTGGDLVVLDSMDFYQELIQYIAATGLNLHDYWVGGRGIRSENQWKWVSGTTVLMETPLWAINGNTFDESAYYAQEPTEFEESLENCGYLDQNRFHYMDDEYCHEVKAAICQLPTWTVSDDEVRRRIPKIQEVVDQERYKELKEIAKNQQL